MYISFRERKSTNFILGIGKLEEVLEEGLKLKEVYQVISEDNLNPTKTLETKHNEAHKIGSILLRITATEYTTAITEQEYKKLSDLISL